MKKIKFLCFYSLLFFSPAIFAETVVQPFADCKITRSKEGWQYDLKYSAGFPFHESKLFLPLRRFMTETHIDFSLEISGS